MKPINYIIRIPIDRSRGDHLDEISRFITYLDRNGIKASLTVESELVTMD